jgi:uncharacterized protein (TIGR00730 family)
MAKSTDRANHAYRNVQFLESSEARPLRILSEYIEPKARFDHYNVKDTIVFFGSARFKPRDQAEAELAEVRRRGGDLRSAERALENAAYYEAARELAHRLTVWSKGLAGQGRRFVVCSGAGPGVMEAANRGASEAKGINLGLGITLPFEPTDNTHITRELSLEFHYFFMRKFWFTYLAKAVVVMPGGFGTMDELFELLTLVQTGKVRKVMPIVLFGTDYWNRVIDFEALVDYGTIDRKDLELMMRTDSVDEAYDHITDQLAAYGLDDPGAKL